MLIAKGIELEKKGKIILKKLDISLNRGEIVCVAGSNGAGKSSFLKAISGVDKDTKGESVYQGINLLSPNRIKALEKIGFMLFPDAFYGYLTVRQNIQIYKNYYTNNFQSILEILSIFNIGSFSDQKVATLSAGQKQRLSIALAFVNKPDLLILDEPFNSIDRENTNEIIKTINFLNKEFNSTFLITGHGLNDLEKIYTRFMIVKKGEIVFNQKKEQIEGTTNIHEIYNSLH
ncbi:ABC transporter ATP-binding protein [Lacihabitans sp. LS3-19]|uniref:ATP-binding cassette domain-containing protein n=1 Tax=Lacihabitans sp. LS3-19 TaxID=2487335 RepID=UPI0020CF68A9|nr:ABC transporter ATP-binding protein [Lacihabitans sp. LS3-19]MCP9766631.1 ABC transporter ATP-binding protein [Lacihabitans sp. LS3-19]